MPFSWKPKGCFLWRHHHYAHMLPTDKATPSRKCTTPWFSRPYRQISAPPDWGEELRCSPPIPHHSYVDKTVFLYPIFWWIRLPNPYTSTFRPSENLLGMIIFTELICTIQSEFFLQHEVWRREMIHPLPHPICREERMYAKPRSRKHLLP